MFQVAKNLKDNVLQFTSSFAGELDATKTYTSLVELENSITNKNMIFPGKIVYVLETKTFYYIDLKIDGNNTFTETIKNEWINHLDNLQSTKDLISGDYELPGYTNEWIYEPLIKSISVPNNTGYTPITQNGQLTWQKSKVEYTGDISHVFDTTIATFDFLTINGFKIQLVVHGEKEGLSLYSSVINILKSTNSSNLQFNEYGVLAKNELDIDFKCFHNASSETWEMMLRKNDEEQIINKVILNIQII